MTRKATTTKAVAIVAVQAPVTHEQLRELTQGRIGKAETPVCIVTHATYGRIALTLDSEFSTDKQGRTRSAYWLRFADTSKAPTQALADAGWRVPDGDKRKGFWHFPNDAAHEFLTGAHVGVTPALLPTHVTPATPATPATPVTQAQAPKAQAQAPTHTDGTLSHLSDKALAQLLTQVSDEIARRASRK